MDHSSQLRYIRASFYKNFEPDYLKLREMSKTKRIVSEEFTKERTGIYFTGWKPCSQSKRVDIIIMKSSKKYHSITAYPGRASLGSDGLRSTTGYFSKGTKRSAIALATFSRENILHEFGHLTGLRHEHIHPEAKTDLNCLKLGKRIIKPRKQQRKSKSRDQVLATTLIFSEYDSESIMNYCYIEKLRNEKRSQASLSEEDLRTLRHIYN